jgi:hypothetical protein
MLLVRAAKDACCAWKPLPQRHSGALPLVWDFSAWRRRRSRSGPVETSA